ncbi:hypothetical protein MHBO_002142 [Bonamia ostreae]|uniref:Uncharacterized protein n=1 Tax=Bonamia ostreae TaxID=126728 RepID=A0ABV2ALD3_9EUKA
MEKKENVADDEDVDENLKREAPNKEERDQDDDEDNFIDIRNERKLFSKQNVNSRMPPIKSKKKVAKRRKAPSNKKRAGSVVKRKRKHKNQRKDHQRAKLSSSRQHKRVKMRNPKIAKNRKNKKSGPGKKKKVDKKYRSEIESDEDEFMDAEEKASMVVTLISDPNEIDPSTLEDAEQHDNIYANFALFMLLVIFVVLIVVFRTCRKTNSVTQRAAMIAFIPQSPGIKKSLSESNKQAPMDQPPPYSPSKPPAQQYY